MISFKNIGPGSVVAAAFIGPGTITMCSIAGTKFGFDLLWALLFSLIITTILQLMAAKIGLITQNSLSMNLISSFKNRYLKFFSIFLILSAILIGNTAYEAGNISGAILGVESLLGYSNYTFFDTSINISALIVGFIAFGILFYGNSKIIQRILILLVLVMSVAFLFSAILVSPNLKDLIYGLLVPKIPEGSLLTIIGLIGTTVVPYNIFLHATLVKDKWNDFNEYRYVKIDTILAVILGGIISISVIITAAALPDLDISAASDLAKGIKPLFGDFSEIIISIGLFSAGLTSAITAPLAAAYVTNNCLSLSLDTKSIGFRFIWFSVLSTGVLFSSLNFKSIEIIKFAQIANGILLPFVAFFLLWLANKKDLLKDFVNNKFENAVAYFTLLIVIILGLKSITTVLGII